MLSDQMPSGVVMQAKIRDLEERLHHAQERYTYVRHLLEFYRSVGADEPAAEIARLRAALEEIVWLNEPGDDLVAHAMVRIAEAALAPTP